MYSVVARFKRHMGLSSTAELHGMLFGTPEEAVYALFPSGLARLARRLPPHMGLTASRLVRRHTLYNYYRAATRIEDSRALYGQLADDRATCGARLFQTAFGKPDRLRFCPECASEMERSHGEMYWRREHQVPSVLLCPWHLCELRASDVKVGKVSNSYHAATSRTCASGAPSVAPACAPDQRSTLEALAVAAADLLASARRSDLGRQAWFDRYEALLREKGLVVGDGRPKSDRMMAVAGDALSHLRPIWPGLFDDDVQIHWTRRVHYRKYLRLDPAYRILARQAVDQLPDVEGPFGRGPWPCLNELADHVGRDIATNLKIKSNGDRHIGRFTCGCGYAYARSRLQDGSLTPPRSMRYGPAYEGLVREAEETGLGISETTRLAGLTRAGITRLRKVEAGLGVQAWERRGRDTATRKRVEREIARNGAFGRGPWLCINPLADHVGRKVVEDLTVRHHRGRYIGTFTCGCGWIYTKSLLHDGKRTPPRFLGVNGRIKVILERLAATCGTVTEAARAAGVRTKFLREIERRIGEETWPKKPSGRLGKVRGT